MMNQALPVKTAVIMAAGTGGHVMPGLAIAAELKSRGWALQWLGTAMGMENKLVPAAGITLEKLNFAGLRGKGVLGLLRGVFQLMAATFQSYKLFKRIQPQVLVGMGGYVCVPGAWAAKLLGIPLVLVNADADILLSNKTLAKQAVTICCGFNGGAAKHANAVVTGNPVRQSLVSIAAPELRYAQRSGPLNLLVVGGSLGAQVLNQTVPQALVELPSELRPHVVHQTGVRDCDAVKALYASLGIHATVVPFIDNMAAAYAHADVMVCRSGAITVSELCAVGMPAILVPFIASTTHHQVGNAIYMQVLGAGIHLPQAQLSADALANVLRGLNRDSLLEMAQKGRAAAKTNATHEVVQLIEKASL